MWWLLWACVDGPTAAKSGSRSADLSIRAGEVSRRADALANATRELEGLYDQLRAAPDAEKPAIRETIHARARTLRDEALALQEEVERIERSGQVF
ncbi:MAG: hypothetical protein ACOZNI_31440 [Myxococcota bacterium]